MNDSSIERRKFKRVSPPPNQCFVYWHETNHMTVITNISMGGFKIECFPFAGGNPDSTTVNIIALAADRFEITGIACRVVYDIANLVEGGPFSGAHSRICGFKFQKLIPEQKVKIEYLINSVNPDPGQ